MIGYDRADRLDVRGSDYRIVPAPDPAALNATLAAALGVRGEVRKRRELLMWRNVRIHLDDVARLGTFVEFEAVLSERDSDESLARDHLATLAAALGVRADDRIAGSYSDLSGL